MEEVKLYCAGACLGRVALRPQGGRTEVRASMEDPGDGLYRASLVGERGTLSLGVLEPEGTGRLGLLRRPYSRDIQAGTGGGTLLLLLPKGPLAGGGAPRTAL